MKPIRYRITPSAPHAHIFETSITVEEPLAQQQFRLPAWIPGSYMIREFSKNVVEIHATANRKPVKLTKLDKHTWQAAPCKGALTVTMQVYAWDLSVRTAHLDATHGFFNGTSVFLQALGHEEATCEVMLNPPSDLGEGKSNWKVATALPRARGTKPYAFGAYRADNYDELVDHPVEMGTFTLDSFTACGVRHDIAITGQHDCDMKRLKADLTRVCEYQIRLFHGDHATAKDIPFKHYTFLVMAVGDGYGGLEHRASTALICARDDLPHAGLTNTTEGYRTFLGLCSHEYFHSWNVKRIKPAAFMPYDLTQETYTPQLWFFEGFTSYYDDLVLVRTGLISRTEYFSTLAKTVDSVMRANGRTKQSVAESSFDAWTKYYRQDENAPNAVVSYYTKGALVALALDLTIRLETRHARSLDDIMRALWNEHGSTAIGLNDGEIEQVSELVSGCNLRTFFKNYVYDRQDPPIMRLFEKIGMQMPMLGGSASIGVKTSATADGVRLMQVLDGGAAQKAGLSAGDIVIAVNGLKVAHSQFDARIKRIGIGKLARVDAFRRDELMQFAVKIGQAQWDSHAIGFAQKISTAQQRAQDAWLGKPVAAPKPKVLSRSKRTSVTTKKDRSK
jgi:predicted metalloprotease with PDZ domain